ncbi:MAG: thiamine diphosphokinase, partial [Clostridiales bacterium]|nr:thiamine diphosphokinase [Clostridiales bacterium]
GAPNQNINFIKNNIDLNSSIIAADSGYITCFSADIMPDLIIGDFDSSEIPSCNCKIIKLPSCKDDTDTLFCVKKAIEKHADEIEIFCALGGRMDHTYSNILCLAYCLDNGVKASIIDEKCKIIIAESELSFINDEKYKFFSVFAFGGDAEGLSISGAKYNLSDYHLPLCSSIGQSNEFKDNEVKINAENGKFLLIFSND